MRETAGTACSGEVVRSGVPLPRSLGVRDPWSLAIVDAAGRLAPAATFLHHRADDRVGLFVPRV